MVVPVFRLMCGLAIAGGAAALYWYEGLSKPDKDRVDKACVNVAMRDYGKAVDCLTKEEAAEVLKEVRSETV